MSSDKYQDGKYGKGYKRLKAWKKAHELCLEVYELTKEFPKSEQFGLVSQMRRTAVSVPANIIEGQTRTRKEFLRFLVIANGSLTELEYYLELSLELNYKSDQEYKKLEIIRHETGMFVGWSHKVIKKIANLIS